MNGEVAGAVVGVGVGATLVMDLWTWFWWRLTGEAGLDYALLGRWVGHLRRGRVRHAAIHQAAPIRGERALGWTCHYLIGIGFSALLVVMTGGGWLSHPSPWPALAFGLLSVAAPFLVMQPAFGLGVAASRTPHPFQARLRSLRTHLVFGLGLYGSALAVAAIRGVFRG